MHRPSNRPTIGAQQSGPPDTKFPGAFAWIRLRYAGKRLTDNFQVGTAYGLLIAVIHPGALQYAASDLFPAFGCGADPSDGIGTAAEALLPPDQFGLVGVDFGGGEFARGVHDRWRFAGHGFHHVRHLQGPFVRQPGTGCERVLLGHD